MEAALASKLQAYAQAAAMSKAEAAIPGFAQAEALYGKIQEAESLVGGAIVILLWLKSSSYYEQVTISKD